MARTHMRCALTGGDASKLRDEDLPTLPDWYPLPAREDDGTLLAALDEPSRAKLRHARAVSEALQGPFDGRRESIILDRDGTPPRHLSMLDGRCMYVLDDELSNKDCAVYRYSPQLSLMHRKAMQAVEDGFNEYGRDYALEAQHDDENALNLDKR